MKGFNNMHERDARASGETLELAYTDKGFLDEIKVPGLQQLQYTYNDNNGTLTSRTDATRSITESFDYDQLRLKSIIRGTDTSLIAFDNLGNITQKTDAGKYEYDEEKIHAVKEVKYYTNSSVATDPDSSYISKAMQDIVYTAFDQPDSITQGNKKLKYTYGLSLSRVKSSYYESNTLKETRIYAGDIEIQQIGDTTRMLHYINGASGVVAIIIKENNTYNYYYTATDHLGSITTVMDDEGNVVAEQSFDAWGRRRNTSNWSTDSTNVVPTWLYRGYTGHEMLDSFQLINMNGRLYDPVIARMLSPDPFVQAPNSLQNYNRYSYVMNNPLSYTDPSGYQSKFLSFLGKIFNPDQEAGGAGGGKLVIPDFLSGIAGMITTAWGATGEGKNTFFDFAGIYGKPGEGYDMPDENFNGNNAYQNESIVLAHSKFYWDSNNNPITIDNISGVGVYITVPGINVGTSYNQTEKKKETTPSDFFEFILGGVGFYNDVKGNALHNDLYWKGKTTGKIYTKNPFTKTKIGWKANSFKASGKAFQGAKAIGSKLGIAGLAITGADMIWGDGLTTSNILDVTFGVAGFIPGVGWMISGSYFLLNTGVQMYSGKSIGEHLDE